MEKGNFILDKKLKRASSHSNSQFSWAWRKQKYLSSWCKYSSRIKSTPKVGAESRCAVVELQCFTALLFLHHPTALLCLKTACERACVGVHTSPAAGTSFTHQQSFEIPYQCLRLCHWIIKSDNHNKRLIYKLDKINIWFTLKLDLYMLGYSKMKANLTHLKGLMNFGRHSTEVILTPTAWASIACVILIWHGYLKKLQQVSKL